MNRKKYIFAVLLALTCCAFGYPSNYGPFPDDAEVERITLSELTHKPSSPSSSGRIKKLMFPIPFLVDSYVNLFSNENDFLAEVIIQGEEVLQPTVYKYHKYLYRVDVYSANLNQDSIVDFVIRDWSGGCGLAWGICNVSFVLSSGDEYKLTTVTSYYPSEIDFIIVEGKPYFIHTSFHGVDECNDGRNHNFWIYNLLAFDEDSVLLNNNAHNAFPKMIWYTFEPNHTETTIITDEQKAELIEWSLSEIYY